MKYVRVLSVWFSLKAKHMFVSEKHKPGRPRVFLLSRVDDWKTAKICAPTSTSKIKAAIFKDPCGPPLGALLDRATLLFVKSVKFTALV